MKGFPEEEKMLIDGYLNKHVRKSNMGYERAYGGFGLGVEFHSSDS